MTKTETKSTVLVKHYLKKLKLPTMLAECEKVAARAAKENVDHLAFLLTALLGGSQASPTPLRRDLPRHTNRFIRRPLPTQRCKIGPPRATVLERLQPHRVTFGVVGMLAVGMLANNTCGPVDAYRMCARTSCNCCRSRIPPFAASTP